MVERPIKKSDRQPKVDTDNNSENLDSKPAVESVPKISKKIIEPASGKDKKSTKADEFKSPANLALARGPKPKPPVKVKTEPEDESEPIADESQDQKVAEE